MLRAMCADLHCAPLDTRAQRLRALLRLRGPAGRSRSDYFADARMAAWVAAKRAQGIDRAFVYCSAMAPYRDGRAGTCTGCSTWSMWTAPNGPNTPPRTSGPTRAVWAREGRALLAFERRAAADFDRTLFVSEQERAASSPCAPERGVALLAFDNGVDARTVLAGAWRSSRPMRRAGPVAVFTGTMDYRPNIDAVTWFAETVLPLRAGAARRRPLPVVGANPDGGAAAGGVAGVITGRVDDVRPYLAQADVWWRRCASRAAFRTRCWRRWRWRVPWWPRRRPMKACVPRPGATCWWPTALRRQRRPWRPCWMGGIRGWARAGRAAVARRYAWGTALAGLDAVMGLPALAGPAHAGHGPAALNRGASRMNTGTEAAARPRPFALVAAMPMAVLASLVAGLVVLGVLFHVEAAAAVRVWLTSTAYSHGFFVLPIALWLAWERRFELARAPVAPAPWAVLLAVPLGVAWFAAERLGLMEGRQLIAVGLVDLLFLAVLGWRLAWAFSAPLLYLFFLVPFGAFFVPALQDVTTWFIVTGLDLLGIPNFTDGYTIDTPAGSFYVAEACAGLRFLIASIAFGVLYACLIYRSVRRRAAFMVASVVIPIIANGLRAPGHRGARPGARQRAGGGGRSYAVRLDILLDRHPAADPAGLPFREDGTAPAVPPAELPAAPKLRMGQLAAVMAGLLAVVACGPVAAALLDRAGPAAPSVTAMPDLVPPAGCVAGAAAMAGPRATSQFACGGATLAVTVETFPPRASPAALFTARREIAGEVRHR